MYNTRRNSSMLNSTFQPTFTGVASAENIQIMHGLYREMLAIQRENPDVETGMKRVQEIVIESSKVVENSTSTSEMIVDAKILHTGTSVVKSNVSSLNTNLTTFTEAKYVRGVLYYMDTSDHIVLVGKEWECLAPVTYKMFRKSHPVTFMLGPMSLDPDPLAEKGKERKRKVVDAQKTCMTILTHKDKFTEKKKDIYDHITKWLLRHYKNNDKQPINYLNFIIDPTDYWKSVENIFHFAFLVRDGSVKMKMIDGLPFVEPVLMSSVKKKKQEQDQPNTNYQFCFSLSMLEWRSCIEGFSIVTPCIPPFPNEY